MSDLPDAWPIGRAFFYSFKVISLTIRLSDCQTTMNLWITEKVMANQIIKLITIVIVWGIILFSVSFLLVKVAVLFLLVRLLVGIVGWPRRSARIRYNQQLSKTVALTEPTVVQAIKYLDSPNLTQLKWIQPKISEQVAEVEHP
jgi:hypothetical protein